MIGSIGLFVVVFGIAYPKIEKARWLLNYGEPNPQVMSHFLLERSPYGAQAVMGLLASWGDFIALFNASVGRYGLTGTSALSQEIIDDINQDHPNYVEKLKAAGLADHGPRENRIRNAARHLSWQMMLAIRYGDDFATTIGEIHETDGFTVDSRMDTKNNAIARRLAIRVMADPALAKYKNDHVSSIASNLEDYKAVIREYAHGQRA
jgi:hypothetical protein